MFGRRKQLAIIIDQLNRIGSELEHVCDALGGREDDEAEEVEDDELAHA